VLDANGDEWTPKSPKEILTAKGLSLIKDWMDSAIKDMEEMAATGALTKKRCRRVLALGPDMFTPLARHKWWDLRDWLNGTGPIKLLQLDKPVDTHLNLKVFKRELTGHPDKELLSFLEHGVSFKADLPYQLVLMPHLISLPQGYLAVQKEVYRLESLGFYGIFKHLAVLPCRVLPQGCTIRDLEPDRPRRTTNASAPHTQTTDTSGQPVTSNNSASKLGPPGVPWKGIGMAGPPADHLSSFDKLSPEEADLMPDWYGREAQQAQPPERLTSPQWPPEIKLRLKRC
jgi:hypothetical protein